MATNILKQGGLDKLNNYTPPTITPLRQGEVPQVYSGSTPGLSIQRDYTKPIGQFTPVSSVGLTSDQYKQLQAISNQNQPSLGMGKSVSSPLTAQQERQAFENQYRIAPQTSTPISAPTSNGFLSKAFNALKGFVSQSGTQNNQQIASVFGAFQPPSSNTLSSSTPTLAPGISTVQTTNQKPQVQSKPEEQYGVKTNTQNQDSATMKINLDAMKAQETAGKQSQIQELQAQLAELVAQRSAIEANQKPNENQVNSEANLYNPEGNSGINSLSSQIQAIEEEIQKATQDSPELQAATQALQSKLAEEAMIKANLNQGITNVQEQPVAQSFISGQSAALERQAEAKLQTNAAQRIPLQQQLANEQAKKQTALDIAKTKYENLKDSRSRLEDIYKTNYQRANTLYDKKLENKFTEVSPGATLYDPKTRQVIYTAPTAKSSSSTTTSTKQPQVKKGNRSSAQFVEDTLNTQGLSYDKVIGDLQAKYPDKIPVINNATGQIGTITPAEFNSAIYTKL